MRTWAEFRHARPDLAEAGRRLLYQFGVGLAFLATVRPDGSPRLHPISPLLTNDALLGFIQPSPKRQDLHRDGRYALHSFLAERRLDTPPPTFGAHDLFEFFIERCLWTATSGHGDWHPRHTTWRSP